MAMPCPPPRLQIDAAHDVAGGSNGNPERETDLALECEGVRVIACCGGGGVQITDAVSDGGECRM
ncbi:uncharacterized protein P884DRAFT_258636 [Thermothelomyces heterothallicus CBS 202.75]|uniref:uncharacterized protein n=1 Tax=Thermothelomyces heterothallicus CBS 202.75 TaxID=1149848 RepID=UPI003743BE38